MRPVDLKAFIETLASQAGEAILPFFRTTLSVQDKGRDVVGAVFDPVTEADRAAETVIRRRIRRPFPRMEFWVRSLMTSGSMPSMSGSSTPSTARAPFCAGCRSGVP